MVLMGGLVLFSIISYKPANNNGANQIKNLMTPDDYSQGEVIIKFYNELEINLFTKKGEIYTDYPSINEIIKENDIRDMKKVFPDQIKYKIPNSSPLINASANANAFHNLNNIFILKFDESKNLPGIINEFKSNPLIEFAEPNYYYSVLFIPNDPLYLNNSQWYINQVNANLAWDSTISDTSQIIAILDSGVDWDHPDLDNNIWRNWSEIPNNGIDDDNNGFVDDVRGWDFINNDNNPNDDNSHGTHVAGIAAAESNNETGICGVAWMAKIMPVKMLQSSGLGSATHLAAAINYASNNGADVINMSLGSYNESLTVKAALENAYSNSLLVASAGNDDYPISFQRMFPACYPFVIGVQSSNQSNSKESFSNWDDTGPFDYSEFEGYNNYEIYAPGVNILSTFPNGTYSMLSGTSMSAPIVSGAAALMKSFFNISSEELFARLIHGSNNGVLDIYQSLIIQLSPSLKFVHHTVLDTLQGCNNDGTIDAGETIEIEIEVQNFGGWADSVYTILELINQSDTNYAEILDGFSNIGDLGIYAILTNGPDLFRVRIDSLTPHEAKIPLQLTVQAANCSAIQETIELTVQRGAELKGILDSMLTLTPDKFWIVNSSFRIEPSGGLIMLPGTHFRSEYGFPNGGTVIAHGTPDSTIVIEGILKDGQADFSWVNFQYGNGYGAGNATLRNCTFNYCDHPLCSGYYDVENCNFTNCTFGLIRCCGSVKFCNFDHFHGIIAGYWLSNVSYSHNNFSNGDYLDGYFWHEDTTKLGPNNYITGPDVFVWGAPIGDVFYLNPQYWGSTNDEIINYQIIDFFDAPQLAQIFYKPILEFPSPLAHGIVWKVEINGVDPQDEYLEPLGPGQVQFDVYFNRAMDTNYAPFLTFGNYAPYDEHVVNGLSSWNPDATIWTSFYQIDQETGDGINTIKVSKARDTMGWEIPEEYRRFKFIIQAASAASIDFTALAGRDSVYLEWSEAKTVDLLGYNLYRYGRINDSTFSTPMLLNYYLLIDTLYTDYDVISGKEYFYYYTIVGTDFQESDKSKIVSATPFAAPPGDANGDLVVNILDITTLVAYILNQQPAPFIFYAADLNHDQIINILDIVGVIQIIVGNKTNPVFEKDGLYNYAFIENDVLTLEVESDIVAIQFKLCDFEEETVQVVPLIEGFEFSYTIQDNYLKGLMYSLDNKQLPKDQIKILMAEHGKGEILLSEIYGCDKNSNLVPIHIINNYTHQGITYPNKLNCSPNPFKEYLNIDYSISEASKIEISIYSIFGSLLWEFTAADQHPGKYQVNWKPEWIKENSCPSEVLYCVLRATPLNNINAAYIKSNKLIFVK